MKPTDALYLVKEIEGKRLYDNEADFIHEIKNLIVRKIILSKRQSVWLKAIYRRVNGGGQYQGRLFT